MLARKTLLPLLGVLAFSTATGCKKGSAPVIQFIPDTEALVGQTLTLQILAVDPEGDAVDFRFEAAGVPDINGTASMFTGADGQGIFTFTPLASQIGSHFFDFIASDGDNDGKLTIEITVRGAVGSGSVPIFRKPLGSGAVLDLEQSDSVSLDIEVEDPDSTEISLMTLPPTIDNSTLNVGSTGLDGNWEWTPTREQIEASDRYDLTLSADDGDNAATVKDFIIVIRKRSGAECPGDAPVIDHSADDFSTVQDLTISAQISDDKGLKSEPYVLYSLEDPGDPVDFAKMTLLEMEQESGDLTDGEWIARIPNPVASGAEGDQAEVFYLISAGDDDDATGDCDHLTDAPASGTFQVSVTNAPGDGAGRCDDCSFDVQCGGDGDLCIAHPDGSFCGAACEDDSACDDGSICSVEPVDSVDGAAARQCIPNSGSCRGGGSGSCTDDDNEPNDEPDNPTAFEVPGTLNGQTLCPGNDDWFEITVSDAAIVSATLAGDNPPDMDLALTTSEGVLIQSSIGLDSDESLASPTCLDPGNYRLRVYTGNSTPGGDYSVGYSLDTDSCTGVVMGEGDCCIDNQTPGCEDAAVQECVCGMDDFCCSTEWDDMCAATAAEECDACDVEVNEDCCTAQQTGGCTDSDIEACVCASDDFCCTTIWDNVCVNQVGSSLCGPACNPDDADGYCCDPNNLSPGCEINSVEECVCDADPFCCENDWDLFCVGAIEENMCGTCPDPR